jgi:hypothetical protein
MGKNQSASNLTNIIKQDANGNISFVSGSTTLMSVSSSGAITTTGNVAGTASYASNAELLDGLNSTVFATTGSNTFTSAQYISNTSTPTNFTDTASLYTDGGMQVKKDVYLSSSLFVKGDLTIFGTQSVNYITSSQLNIATNIITVNTSTPAVRFGGIAVQDSGSLATGLTGSLLWDSQNNHWVYTNPSGSSYSGGMLISGPRASSLGEEQGTTFNALIKGQGGDHITSSGIFESGSNMGIGTASPSYKLDVQGTGRFTDALIVNKVAINSGNLTLSNFPSLDLIVSGGIGFSSGGSGAAALVNRDGSGNITFYGSSGDIKFTDITLTSNYLTIKNAGNVGIGIISPYTKLQIQGGHASIQSNSTAPTDGAGDTRNAGFGFRHASADLISALINTTAVADWGLNLHFNTRQFNASMPATPAMTITAGQNVGIGTSSPSQKLHIIGGELQTYGNSSWYRNVFERNMSTWETFVSFTPQSNPQYTYGFINITASGYVNGTSAGGVTTSRWYYSITNNSISVSVVGTDITQGSQAPSIRLIVSSNVINVQAQSGSPGATSYTTMFVDAMLASGYINGTNWVIS